MVAVNAGDRSLRLTGNEGSNQGLFWPHIELSLFCLHSGYLSPILMNYESALYKKVVKYIPCNLSYTISAASSISSSSSSLSSKF